jgi:hypothetical protein
MSRICRLGYRLRFSSVNEWAPDQPFHLPVDGPSTLQHLHASPMSGGGLEIGPGVPESSTNVAGCARRPRPDARRKPPNAGPSQQPSQQRRQTSRAFAPSTVRTEPCRVHALEPLAPGRCGGSSPCQLPPANPLGPPDFPAASDGRLIREAKSLQELRAQVLRVERLAQRGSLACIP